MIPVRARIGATEWETSLFPKGRAVRRPAEGRGAPGRGARRGRHRDRSADRGRRDVTVAVTDVPAERLCADLCRWAEAPSTYARNVRNLVRTEIGLLVALAVGAVVAYVGFAVSVSGRNRFEGGLVLVLGLWLMVSAPVVHDRIHRERGEETHAVWGRRDRRKPPWWPAK
jgi:hypothetical protein